MATQRIGNNRIADGEVTGPKLGLNSINANNLSSSVNTYITNLISGGDPTANAASIYANGAFVAANSAGVYANGAFAAANVSTGVNLTQNTSITAAFNQANAAFISANNIDGINATQNNNITAAFNTANAAFVSANSINGVDLSQNNRIAYSETTSNAAFTRANNSLNANTGGVIGGAVTVSSNLTVVGDTSITGNLYVSGNTVSISAGSIVANDSLIVLGIGNYVSDIVDLGFAAHYNAGTNAHSGLIRDSGTKEWHLFKGYVPDVGGTNNIDINDATFATDTLNANIKAPGIVTVKGIDLLVYANNMYNTANAAFASANVGTGVDVTQNNSITAAFNQANLAFTTPNYVANSAASYANSAFITGNSAFIQANAAFVRANNSLDANNGGTVAGPVVYQGPNASLVFNAAPLAVRANLNIQSVTETANIISTAIGGNTILYLANNSSYYFAANPTANITFDLRANSQAGGTLDNYLTTGQIISVGVMLAQGATAYRANLYIDGVLQTANTRWSGNVNPAAGGTINGIDVYTFSVLKRGANSYIILASNTAFANGATSVY